MENNDNSINVGVTNTNPGQTNINPNNPNQYVGNNTYGNNTYSMNPNQSYFNNYPQNQNEINNPYPNSYGNGAYVQNQNSLNAPYNMNPNMPGSTMNQGYPNNNMNNCNGYNQAQVDNCTQYMAPQQNCNYNYYSNNIQPNNNNNPIDTLRKEKGDRLCIFSIVSLLAPGIICSLIYMLTGDYTGIAYKIADSLVGLMAVVSLILMIVCRVKYPENKFGKVLMWVYISFFALAILGGVLVILIFMTICSGCSAL